MREFPYRAIESVAPDGKTGRLRPVVIVGLLGEDGRQVAQTRGLIDSGADCTTLPAEWAKLLGIDLEQDCIPEHATQVGGDRSLRYVYTGGLSIDVVDEVLFLDVAHFCDEPPCAFLGRRDLFDRHLVLFDQRRLRLYLERQPPTPDDEDDDPDADLALAVT